MVSRLGVSILRVSTVYKYLFVESTGHKVIHILLPQHYHSQYVCFSGSDQASVYLHSWRQRTWLCQEPRIINSRLQHNA